MSEARNNLKINFDGELVRRFKEKTKSDKELFYIAVKVPRGEFTDTFKVKVRDAESVKMYPVGSKVAVSAFVGGRDWTSPEGKIAYFLDLNLATIGAIPAEAEKKPKLENPEPTQAELDEMPF